MGEIFMKETTIMIGSTNQGKIDGLKLAFEKYGDEFGKINVIGVKADSEVADQPVNTDTLLGAKNRVKNAKKYAKANNIKADYFVAIESGIFNNLGLWQVINIAVIEDENGLHTYGQSAGFPVPNYVAKHAIKTNLSDAMDLAFNQDKNVAGDRRQGKGGIGLLTDDKITRIDLTVQAFVMAIIPIRKTFWKDEEMSL